MRRRRNAWLRIGTDAMVLGLEASSVIGLRSLKIAQGGPRAEAEAKRMVAEKLEAARVLATLNALGALGFTAPSIASHSIAHLRRKVRANRRRLAKG